jgi:hypothetical protein
MEIDYSYLELYFALFSHVCYQFGRLPPNTYIANVMHFDISNFCLICVSFTLTGTVHINNFCHQPRICGTTLKVS